MKFVDEISFNISSGHGGAGLTAFRRERFIPRGGPNGGEGGKGGSLIFEATSSRNTLVDYRFNKIYRADAGQPGGKNNMTGRGGKDLILLVPVGTMIYNEETGELIADLDVAGARHEFEGGRGGKGNSYFKTATMRTPRHSQEGQPGVEIKVRLELKLIADVGLVGFPNAGKSTFISRISEAKPKIADYPFTTLVPNLGVVSMSLGKSFVVADIPGLIEGAHEGIGLGHAFLKHIERCAAFIHLVPADDEDPVAAYHKIQAELSAYDSSLVARHQIVVLSKVDLLQEEEREELRLKLAHASGGPVFAVSSVSGQGLKAVLFACWEVVQANKTSDEPKKIIYPADTL